MLEILLTVLFVWLLFKVIGLAFRVAWGAAKIAASILFTLAVPLLVLCLIFAGGVLILIPLAMLGAAFGLLKGCTKYLPALWAGAFLVRFCPCGHNILWPDKKKAGFSQKTSALFRCPQRKAVL